MSDSDNTSLNDVLPLVYKYAPYPILAAVVLFMLHVRLLSYGSVVRDGFVFFSGNDPWYHKRIIHYITQNFPNPPNFDAWSHFPYGTGTHSGFGGLFDQIIALFALILGGGNPSAHQVEVVAAIFPAIFGAATVIPAYFIVKKVAGKWSAVFSAIALSVFSGSFVFRTMVGVTDHQSAEPLFVTIAVLGILHMVQTVYAEKPTLAHVKDRDWEGLKKPVRASVLGGFAASLYLMMWPPGVMIFSTFGLFIAFQMVRDHLDGKSTEYLAFGAIVSFTTTALFTLIYARNFTLTPTSFSLLQPLTALLLAFGTAFLYFLSSYIDENGYDPLYYPGSIVASLVASLGVVWILLPKIFQFVRILVQRIYSYGYLTTAEAGTVGEIQAPPKATFDFLIWQDLTFPISFSDPIQSFGRPMYAMFFLAFGVLVWRFIKKNEKPGEHLLIFWAFTSFSAYMTMNRFEYYFAVTVAIFVGYFVWWISQKIEITDIVRSDDGLRNVKGYQVITLAIVLFLVLPGNVIAMGSLGSQPVQVKAMEIGDRGGPSDAEEAWNSGLTWMKGNTPDIPMDYYKYFSKSPEGDDYAYPEGTYGVMSWWDYGHWITSQAERIPFANPFQQGPVPASAYLQATNETRANLILEALPSLKGRLGEVGQMSNEELRKIIENQNQQKASEDIRYVMIDDQMVISQKFSPITRWTGPSYSSYISPKEFRMVQQGNGTKSVRLNAYNSKFDNTMISSLYFGDASQLEHYRLVHETNTFTLLGAVAGQTRNQQIVPLGTPAVYRRLQYANRSSIRNYPSSQLVRGQRNRYFYDLRKVATVKTFERVEGATIKGEANVSNATVIVSLGIRTNTNRTFAYYQTTTTNDEGEFKITVPYSTKGNVSLEEGGTNSAVKPVSNYSVSVGKNIAPYTQGGTFRGIFGGVSYEGTVEVSEEAIYDGDTVEVELKKAQSGNESKNGSNNQSDSNGSGTGDGSSGNDSSSDNSSGNQSSSAGSSGNESESLARPGYKIVSRISS